MRFISSENEQYSRVCIYVRRSLIQDANFSWKSSPI